jgi:hypothetical protein
MKRLHTEWRRLFAADAGTDGSLAPLLDAHGERTRTLVVEWGRPADWQTLRPLWEAVQAELGWPAPLIALNGCDAFQLWISLAEPVAAREAHEAAAALAARWLPRASGPAIATHLTVWPRPSPQADGTWQHAAPVPARQAGPQPRWSAFVAPDLAAVFGDEPTLDIDPGDEAQADLVARGGCVSAAAWTRASQALHQDGAAPASTAAAAPECPPSPAGDAVDRRRSESPRTTPDLGGPHDDPAAFLKAVMNHAAVPLALRIEAARALLQDPRRSQDGAGLRG